MTPAAGDERRNRESEPTWKGLIQYVIPLFSIMFAVGVAYSSLRTGVEHNERSIKAACGDVKLLDGSVKANREDIIKIQGDVTYIKQGVDQITKSIDKLDDKVSSGGTP